jgi:hypothetical protein
MQGTCVPARKHPGGAEGIRIFMPSGVLAFMAVSLENRFRSFQAGVRGDKV